MIIGSPKIRRIMNSTIDNVGFCLFLPVFAMAIIGGTILGFVERKYNEIRKSN
jgi:tetrahydromethanopterin S-methyltransferase subunit D